MTELEQLHAIARAASIPPDRRFVDAPTAAAMLSYSTDHFIRRIATRADFPAARDLGGNPRWLLNDVAAWAQEQPIRLMGKSRSRARDVD